MNIANIAGGALVEQVDTEIQRVLENIIDPNTEATKKRKITITLVFEPIADRDATNISFTTKSTLVPAIPVETRVAFERDGNGNVIAEELVRGSIKGQSKIDHETGEIIESVITSKIVSLK